MQIRNMVLVALAVLITACQSVQTTQPGAVGVNRKQYMLVPEEDIERGAQEAYN